MKKSLSALLASLALCTSLAVAQDLSNSPTRLESATSAPSTAHDVNGFYAPGSAPALNSEAMKKFPNPHPDLRPRAGGIFTDGGKYGTVMISPFAPSEYGMGEKYLAAPSPSYDVQHESGPAAHRPAGGLKLFSWEF
jgi:hypothetical protein